MNKFLLFIGFVLFLIICSNGIQGQTTIYKQQIKVKSGDRIRLKVTGMQSLNGKFGRLANDTVAILMGKDYDFITLMVPKDKIIKIDVFQESRFTPLEKILIGTLVGATAGVVFGLVVPDSPTLDNGGFYYWTRGGTAFLWGLIGAGGGLSVGLGVAVATSEKWAPASFAGKPLNINTYFTNISIGCRIRFGN